MLCINFAYGAQAHRILAWVRTSIAREANPQASEKAHLVPGDVSMPQIVTHSTGPESALSEKGKAQLK